VSLITVSDYATGRATVTAEGTVESLDQAELRSQVNTPVAHIAVAIGDQVQKGQTLVTLQSADIAAQLDQAKAGLAAQQAQLAEMQKGARAEDVSIQETVVQGANQDLANLYANAVNTLNDAYAKADDAVRKQTDQLYTNDEGLAPALTFQTQDNQAELDAENKRYTAGHELSVWKGELSALGSAPSETAVDAAITHAEGHLAVIRDFLNAAMDAIVASIGLPQATLDSYKLNISTARASVTAALTAVTGAEQGLSSQRLTIAKATEQLNKMRNGATQGELDVQQAAVASAAAQVATLEVQLAKTVIRSPIAGTISAIPVRVGELVTVGQSVISIVNVNGLEVKGYVSESDLPFVAEGADATIEGGIPGKVNRVAPSVNAATKKVEVIVLVTDPDKSGLVVGENVGFSITAVRDGSADGSYLLPLQAVRVSSSSASVYTVNADSRIEEHAVTLGDVRGEFVEVTQGLAGDMRIVSPVYELQNGEEVVHD
jgi:HlyD family secretion protein